MAQRPKSICRHVACGRAIDAPGYCEKHKKESVGWTRSHGDKSAAERGYGPAWRKMREHVLHRDRGLCQIKGPKCLMVAREVDHKVNKERAMAMGWTEEQIEDESNLQSVCTPCHKAKTKAESRR